MIITKTPFRMSFFGGGSDIEKYFKENGGAVLSTTFDKYCYVTVRKLPHFFEYTSHLTYSKTEYVNSIEEIDHPAIRNAMKMVGIDGIRMIYDADLPARSGLGTSSSFAVGMLNAFYAMQGKYVTKEKLARDAIYLERVLCNESGGWQDQIAAAYGGLNRIDFNSDGFNVTPISISDNRRELLNNNLMLFFTGFTRFSADVQNENKIASSDNYVKLADMVSLVNRAQAILEDDKSNINEFGYLLNLTWELKKSTGSKISSAAIDELYNSAIKAGAMGGKLLGAGGGGFLLFYVEPPYQEAVKKALCDLLYIPFRFENKGTVILSNAK